MPKAGETPEMGSNPQIGFGRVYARPGGGALARPARRAPAERPRLRVGRVLRRHQVGSGDHRLGRGHRHAREHVALRQGRPDRADDGAPPVQPAAAHLAAVRGLRRHAHPSARGRGPRGGAGRPHQLPDAARARRQGHRTTRIPASGATTSTSGRSAARAARRASAACGRPGRTRACTSSRTAGACRPAWKRSPSPGPTRRPSAVGSVARYVGRGASPVHLRRVRRFGRGGAVGQPRSDARPRRLDGRLHVPLRPAVRARAGRHAARPARRRTSPHASSAWPGCRWTPPTVRRLPADDPRGRRGGLLPGRLTLVRGRLLPREAVGGAGRVGLHAARSLLRRARGRGGRARRVPRDRPPGLRPRRQANHAHPPARRDDGAEPAGVQPAPQPLPRRGVVRERGR